LLVVDVIMVDSYRRAVRGLLIEMMLVKGVLL
jgi:hypothetical protein